MYSKQLSLALIVVLTVLLSSCEFYQCRDVNCLNEGTCESGECVCLEGFSGEICEVEDRCITADVDCANGGKCDDGDCDCPEGFSGKECQTEDLCITSDPNCLNGGRCEDGACDCPQGFTGSRCQNQVTAFDKCDTVSCDNNQPCFDGSCECDEWTEGLYCSDKVINVYISEGEIDGEWFNATTNEFVATGSIEFSSSTEGLQALDLTIRFNTLVLPVYTEFSAVDEFEYPEQIVDNFTLEGEGYRLGNEWRMDLYDQNTRYNFIPL